jgi:hypothetical protein
MCAVLLSCIQRLLNYLASQSVGGRRGRDHNRNQVSQKIGFDFVWF